MTNEKSIYDLLEEPAGSLYRQIVEFSRICCSFALLVVRPELELGERGKQTLSALEPFLVEKMISSRWPGTELLDGDAEVFLFRLQAESAERLGKVTDHLYGWLQPDLPEDLCLLSEHHEPWLTTIAHERDGFLHLTESERQRLLHGVPGLKLAEP